MDSWQSLVYCDSLENCRAEMLRGFKSYTILQSQMHMVRHCITEWVTQGFLIRMASYIIFLLMVTSYVCNHSCRHSLIGRTPNGRYRFESCWWLHVKSIYCISDVIYICGYRAVAIRIIMSQNVS